MSDKKCPVIFKNNCNDCDEKNCNDCYFKIKMGDDKGKYALCRNGWGSCSEKSKILRSYNFCTKKKRKPRASRTHSSIAVSAHHNLKARRDTMKSMAERDKKQLIAVRNANKKRLQTLSKKSKSSSTLPDFRLKEHKDPTVNKELEKELEKLLKQGGGIKRKTRRRKKNKQKKQRKTLRKKQRKKRKKRRRTRKK